MKLQSILGGLLALSLVSCGGEKTEETNSPITLVEESDSLSYAIGIAHAEYFPIKDLKEVSQHTLEKGFSDYLSGAHSVSGEECNTYIGQFIDKYSENRSEVSENVYDSLSYALGVYYSEVLKYQGVPNVEGRFLAAGFVDKMSNSAKLDSLEIDKVFKRSIEKQEKLKAQKMEEQKKKFAAKIEADEKFLAENAKRPEVITLPSGLQYEIIKEGKGEIPVISSTVKAHYTGMLTSGKVFQTTEGRDPIDFQVSQVVRGWTEALQLMPVGSKWKLYIPQELAYGPQAKSADIQPYTALIFDIELVDIVK